MEGGKQPPQAPKFTADYLYRKLNPNNYAKYAAFVLVGVTAITFLALPSLANYYAQIEVADEINEHRRKRRELMVQQAMAGVEKQNEEKKE